MAFSHVAAVMLLVVAVAQVSRASVIVEDSRDWDQVASIRAADMAIEWSPLLPNMPPLSSQSFSEASETSLWTTKLDGPGASGFQTLLVRSLSVSSLTASALAVGSLAAA